MQSYTTKTQQSTEPRDRALAMIDRLFMDAVTDRERRLLVRLVLGLIGIDPDGPTFTKAAERFEVVQEARDVLRCQMARRAAA